MIEGFEEQTHELTEYELACVHSVISYLRLCVGVERAVKNYHIADNIGRGSLFDTKITPPRMRKIINYIRINNLLPCLCSNSKGYYVARDKEELDSYIKSLYQRIKSISDVYEALRKQRERHFLQADEL